MRDLSKDITLQIESTTHAHTAESITIWLSHNFAPEWFADALHEAKTVPSHNSRRREIIFAVCCAKVIYWNGCYMRFLMASSGR